MSIRDVINLLLLAALWGISFLFIRVSAPEFGAIPLIAVRVALASLVLLPLVCARRGLAELREHWRPIVMTGLLHYAIPFPLFAWAMLTLTGGFSAIINASSPLFAGVVAVLWLGERLPPSRIAGLITGFVGVVVLVQGQLGPDAGAGLASTAAAVCASCCYGIAAVLAKRRLANVDPVNAVAGSLLVATIALLPAAIWLWPDTPPSATAWLMAAVLGIACTALGFILYFRLIASIGPTQAISVTFLIPVFAVAFGLLLLEESLTTAMLVGGIVIMAGTALCTGLLTWSPRRHATVTRRSRQARGVRA